VIIIGIDPGETTGLFAASGTHLRPYANTEQNPYEAMRQLDFLLETERDLPDVHVVCERFTQQSMRMSPQYAALETIGVVRWLCTRWGAELTLQSRSQKAIVTSFMLKSIGWWTSGLAGHANDAARHALIWLATHHPNHTLVQRTIGTIAAIG
jgi:hypothetical protein